MGDALSEDELWLNRIVGSAEVAPESLLANPANWRLHPAKQQNAVRDVLGRKHGVGWVARVMVNKRTSELWPEGDRFVETVVDGHLRVALAMRHNQPTVPVDYVDLTPEEERLVLLTLDPTGAMATASAEQLGDLIKDLDTKSDAIGDMLSNLAKDAGLPTINGEPIDAEPQIDRAEELRVEWDVKTGQIWQLGEHRLVCGDCTDRAVVDAAVDGTIDLWVTDPFYNVSYASKNEYLNKVDKGNRVQTPIENDNLEQENAAEIWRMAFSIAYEIAKPGCVYYINAPQGGDQMIMMMMLKESGWLLKPQIIWVKNNHVLGRSDYQLKHEPILYGWKDGGAHYWCGSRSEMSVWEIDRPQKSAFHPTTKPVELAEKAIENSSRHGEIVFDGFLGSGTTLMACERLGRKCCAIEKDRGYVAVALQRWADATGMEPKLL